MFGTPFKHFVRLPFFCERCVHTEIVSVENSENPTESYTAKLRKGLRIAARVARNQGSFLAWPPAWYSSGASDNFDQTYMTTGLERRVGVDAVLPNLLLRAKRLPIWRSLQKPTTWTLPTTQ